MPLAVTALSAGLFAGIVLGLSSVVSQVNGIQMDGNIAKDSPSTTGVTDWAALFTGGDSTASTSNPAFSNDGFSEIQAHVFVKDFFTPDGTYHQPSDDDEAVNVTDSTGTHVGWGCVEPNNPTDKDDILNAYAVIWTPTSGPRANHTILYFGGERFANNGDAFIGIWMFQNNLSCLAADLGGTGEFTGAKADGDILLQSNFTNGGTISVLVISRWDNTLNALVSIEAPNAACSAIVDPGSTSNACAEVFTGSNMSTAGKWYTQDKTSAVNTLQASEFFEGILDLTNLLGGGLPENTPCFGTFMLETRASQSLSSTLKDYAEGQLNTCPNVHISKTGNGTVNAGETSTFTITATNDGPGVAHNVVVTDTLPAGNWTVVSTPAATSGCTSPASGTLSCTYATLAAGAHITIDLSRVTAAADCGALPNVAHVTATKDTNPSDNDASFTNHVICPDLTVTKTGNGTINAGDTATFTITVTNNGPGTAFNVTAHDTLPSGSWAIGGANAAQCNGGVSPVSGSLNCSFGTLTSGATRTFTLSRVTTATDCGTLPNPVTVAATNEASIALANNSASATITVLCPDLRVIKTGNGTINAGDTATFTITVTNLGPGTAYNVTAHDTLPSGSWAIGGADAAACNGGVSPVSGTMDCNFGTMASGATKTVTLSRVTTATDCGALPNTISVAASNEASATLSNNNASATITVQCPDLTVSKTGNGTVNAGETSTFSITLTNLGPGTAYNVTLHDTLPSGTWNVGGADAAGNCPATATGTLDCTFGTLASGASRTITLSRSTTAADCGALPNAVRVAASNEASSALANNTSSFTDHVLCPNVHITKTGNGTVNAGDTTSFTITVTNDGPGTILNVVVTDTLPSGSWTVSSSPAATSGCGSPASGTLSCTYASLAFPGSITITLSRLTTAADCGALPNIAHVSATGDTNTSDNDASATNHVICPDLQVVKTGNGTVNAGDTTSFSITLTNLGPGTAYNVTLHDTLPSGTWAVDGPDSAGNCPASATGTLDCTFGTLASGASRTITLSRLTTPADCGALPNAVRVGASNEPSGALGNNTSSATNHVVCPNVRVAKTGNGTISAGQTATFTITVTNDGPGTATNVVVTDTLPSGSWTVLSTPAATSGCTSPASGTLSCTYASLAFPGSITINLSRLTTAADCGPLDNFVQVTATGDTNPGDNGAFAEDIVLCPDLRVIKTGNGTINAGETATFTITVTNLGPGTAFNVTAHDTLPSGSWAIGGADAAQCNGGVSPVSGSLNCSFGTMASGATRTVTLSRLTVPADCGTLPNTISVAASNEASATLSNNNASATITVICPNVHITKTGNGTITAGQTATFTITVTNDGPGAASNVVVTDTLPSGSWTVSSSPAATSGCASPASGTLSCTYASLAFPGSITITLSRLTTPADCGTLPNLVHVTADHDTNPNDNDASATIIVNCPSVQGKTPGFWRNKNGHNVLDPDGNGTINNPITDFPLVGTIGTIALSDKILSNDSCSGVISCAGLFDNLNSNTVEVLMAQTLALSYNILDVAGYSSNTIASLGCNVPSPLNAAPFNLSGSSSVGTVKAIAYGLIAGIYTTTTQDQAGAMNSLLGCLNNETSDLSVTKTGNGPISAGATATFTIVVTNSVAGGAFSVVLKDTLPSGSWTVGGPNAASCSTASGVVTCNFGTLFQGASRTITLTQTSAPVGVITNTAKVTSTNDPSTGNNSSTASITVS